MGGAQEKVVTEIVGGAGDLSLKEAVDSDMELGVCVCVDVSWWVYVCEITSTSSCFSGTLFCSEYHHIIITT